MLHVGRTKSMTEKITEGSAQGKQIKDRESADFSSARLGFICCGACWLAGSISTDGTIQVAWLNRLNPVACIVLYFLCFYDLPSIELDGYCLFLASS